MKIEIKSWLTGATLFEGDFSCISEAVCAAFKSRANLYGANLYGADLSRANLSGANLSSADLSGANLSGADLYAYACVCFIGHGECGRQLTAIRHKKGDEPKLWCGCFSGSVQDLRDYIAMGDAKLAKTRTLALETVLVLLDAKNEEVQP